MNPGDCALDVGANIGGLAIAMSRVVGPAGRVHAFEANPFTVPRLKTDLAANNATNVTVVPRAAWSLSGSTIKFYCDDSYYASASGFRCRGDNWKEVEATTITLDDYCCDNQLAPRAIKLDVEGAELEVLRGAEGILDRYSPSFVFEYAPASKPEDDPLEFLRARGYVCYDTNLYRRVDRDFYLRSFSPPPLVNVLALGARSPAREKYDLAAVVTHSRVHCSSGTTTSGQMALRHAGRYLVSADLDGPDEAMAALYIFDQTGRRLAYVQTEVEHLRTHSCSNLILQVDGPMEIACTISSPDGAPVSLKRVTIDRIAFAEAA